MKIHFFSYNIGVDELQAYAWDSIDWIVGARTSAMFQNVGEDDLFVMSVQEARDSNFLTKMETYFTKKGFSVFSYQTEIVGNFVPKEGFIVSIFLASKSVKLPSDLKGITVPFGDILNQITGTSVGAIRDLLSRKTIKSNKNAVYVDVPVQGKTFRFIACHLPFIPLKGLTHWSWPREKALAYLLKGIADNESVSTAFIFGDLNFRISATSKDVEDRIFIESIRGLTMTDGSIDLDVNTDSTTSDQSGFDQNEPDRIKNLAKYKVNDELKSFIEKWNGGETRHVITDITSYIPLTCKTVPMKDRDPVKKNMVCTSHPTDPAAICYGSIQKRTPSACDRVLMVNVRGDQSAMNTIDASVLTHTPFNLSDHIPIRVTVELPHEGAGGKAYVKYQNRRYKVRKEKRTQYILVKKEKVFLKDIKGKYEKQ